MSGNRLTKDDLSEYLVKLQKLQRMCMGCRKFRITTEETSIRVTYSNDPDLLSDRLYFTIMLDDFSFYAEQRYNELKEQLKNDKWL